MPLTIDDVKQAREWGITTHQPWKAQININDAISAAIGIGGLRRRHDGDQG